MTQPNVVTAWLEDCEAIADEAHSLACETSKLVHGWQVVDSLRMKQIVQSLYHVSWFLKSIRDNMGEITKNPFLKPRSSIEDLQYEDVDQLTSKDLEQRTHAWYLDATNLHQIITKVLRGLASLGVRPIIIGVLHQHFGLDLDFFKRQYEDAGGTL